MPEHPLKIIDQLDPEFAKLVENTREFALSDGAIPRKYKLLIALALDASHGAEDGVKSLTHAAMHEGATKKEIIEAIRVAQYICGVGSVYTSARALKEIF
ncbi:MAG: carboxymuconolactone decarboxylase family protein [Methanosarcinaceae archaeon]|nr:carboxymuconolactone decarboxylase family protein [Methanosarcinaceae archaeon]